LLCFVTGDLRPPGCVVLARITIALRTSDYGDPLPAMLKALDEAFGANPHYLG